MFLLYTEKRKRQVGGEAERATPVLTEKIRFRVEEKPNFLCVAGFPKESLRASPPRPLHIFFEEDGKTKAADESAAIVTVLFLSAYCPIKSLSYAFLLYKADTLFNKVFHLT